MLSEDPSDPGTFVNPGDFIEDDSDPGTFQIAGVPVLVPEHRAWVEDDAEEGADVEQIWGWVTAFDLPLTVGDGDMRADVGLP